MQKRKRVSTETESESALLDTVNTVNSTSIDQSESESESISAASGSVSVSVSAAESGEDSVDELDADADEDEYGDADANADADIDADADSVEYVDVEDEDGVVESESESNTNNSDYPIELPSNQSKYQSKPVKSTPIDIVEISDSDSDELVPKRTSEPKPAPATIIPFKSTTATATDSKQIEFTIDSFNYYTSSHSKSLFNIRSNRLNSKFNSGLNIIQQFNEDQSIVDNTIDRELNSLTKQFQQLGKPSPAELALQRKKHILELTVPIDPLQSLYESIYNDILLDLFTEQVQNIKKLLPLNPIDSNTAKSLIYSNQTNQLIADAFSIEIRIKDLNCLKRLSWLNDEIINFYMNLLLERNKLIQSTTNSNANTGNKPLNCYFFSTFFYTKLSSGSAYNYSTVSRWTKKIKHQLTREFDIIFIPINVSNNHWCLAAINFKIKQLQYYDSMGGRNERALSLLRCWLIDEYNINNPTSNNNNKITVLPAEWTSATISNIPQQNNSSDCGVFTLKFADYLSEGLALSFGPADMEYFRNRIALEIKSQRII